MEELGIGRPSTYASILQVLKDRGYVKLEKKRCMARTRAASWSRSWKTSSPAMWSMTSPPRWKSSSTASPTTRFPGSRCCKDFWVGFIGAVNDIKDLRVTEVLDALDEMLGPHIYPPRADGGDVRQCPTCGTGKLNLKAGKFGAFVGCSNYPECRYTRPLAADSEASADRMLGKDPETDLDVVVKAGRFGPYIQLGEQKDYAEGEKPKRAGIPKNMSPGDIELELALKLLSLPREIGKHPETGEPITAGIGRFGPFVRHEKTYASLEAGDEVFDIGLNRAVTLIAEKIAKGPSGRRFGADPGKPLGDHPSLGGVAVKNGRYGAYVTAGGVNATIPSDKTPETITLAEAIALIDERAAKGGGKPKRGAKKAAAKKATAKPAESCRARRGKARQEGGREEGGREAEIGRRSKARAPVASAAKTSAAKPAAATKDACEEERGQGTGMKCKTKHDKGFPGRDAIVAFIRAHPGKIGTREIAREFGLKNADRVELKRILRELADEGTVARRGRKIHEPADPAPDRGGRHHRPRHRRRIAGHAHRMGHRGKRPRAKNPHSRSAPPAAGHRSRRRRPRADARREAG